MRCLPQVSSGGDTPTVPPSSPPRSKTCSIALSARSFETSESIDRKKKKNQTYDFMANANELFSSYHTPVGTAAPLQLQNHSDRSHCLPPPPPLDSMSPKHPIKACLLPVVRWGVGQGRGAGGGKSMAQSFLFACSNP